ncbi:MAG: restriction endonuclease subunit S [Patescibacteria group bacterium]
MLNNVKLSQVAHVISGYTFRTALPDCKNGNIAVVQAKNIAPGVPITRETALPKVTLEQKSSNATVQDGDVLLASRGTAVGGFKATLVADPGSSMIAASSVYVLRPDTKIFSAGYLVVFLNSEIGQETLRRISTGSNIRTLLIKELQEMEIPRPSFLAQQTLASVYENISNQTQLLNKRKSLLQDILASTIKSSVHA